MKLKNLFALAALCVATLTSTTAMAQSDTMRWKLTPEGSILWSVADKSIPHYDHIEMSGEQVSVVYRYGVRPDGSWTMERSVVWPMLRTIPNNTHASLTRRFAFDVADMITVNGYSLYGCKVQSVELNGVMTARMTYGVARSAHNRNILRANAAVELTAEYFPSTTKAAVCERYTLRNLTDHAMSVEIPGLNSV